MTINFSSSCIWFFTYCSNYTRISNFKITAHDLSSHMSSLGRHSHSVGKNKTLEIYSQKSFMFQVFWFNLVKFHIGAFTLCNSSYLGWGVPWFRCSPHHMNAASCHCNISPRFFFQTALGSFIVKQPASNLFSFYMTL